jgi:F0F1-type ATP synthase epsilon subunit
MATLPTHLTLEVVTPDRSVVTERVDEVEIPGADGYFGVLPGHTPLLAMLKVGELWCGRDRWKVTGCICPSRSGSPRCCRIG